MTLTASNERRKLKPGAFHRNTVAPSYKERSLYATIRLELEKL